ncbi:MULTISPECIES: hypothetical protein [unclassified Oceanispirochaeta]|uniref:hypothetical protein n=1 Tax=unclassified Oceanispirochaeta TaxID=2635722 RepID=UPI000E099642|nr:MULTISPECIES: hypothetical protein [unclassified Oceanispirochaeta]MBF9015190.1 hypothetical protein [Oceanispirochaeta sp. M2]NPD71648.1 hypothetical protein [Oceanispirochaeta sp. M1]RDG33212.1 hypothetical protein DV872_05995 [Oceanispirochaeta sp. M1]
MSLNFFKTDCQETARKDHEFGICDPQDSTKAYTSTTDPKDLIAIVKNESKKELVFTAIDKCVLSDT